MLELRMNHADPRHPGLLSSDGRTSLPERELLGFINTVSEMIGPEANVLLREIWLDELASLDCMPEPSSSEWHLVTLAALRRLAMRLITTDCGPTHSWGV
jgi:hypothetical protein